MARTPDLERRQELLDRIVVYLAENGLAQATLRPMAASLGVSINRLVHHFGTKEELVASALERALEQQIEVKEAWVRRNPGISVVDIYRKWWKWINDKPANLALVRLNYEAAMLDPKVSGLAPSVRSHQIGVWRHDIEHHFESEGLSHEHAALEAALAKAMFTGLVMDLLATGERRRLNQQFQVYLERLDERLAAARAKS